MLPAAPLVGAPETALEAHGDRLEAVRRRMSESERIVRSADGLVRVSVPPSVAGADSLTLLRFAGEVRGRLAALLDEPLDDEAYALDLRVADLSEGQTPEVRGGTRRPIAPPLPFVTVYGLGQIAPEDVTAALCDAYLRANAVIAGQPPPPPWMGRGVARLLDVAVRQDDAERVIARLEAGTLPPLAELLRPAGSPAGDDPALAAQVAAWLLDGSPRGARFRALRDASPGARQAGEPPPGEWDSAAVLAVAAGVSDPATADALWHGWLSRRRWSILTPGSTHPAFVRRLRGLLALHGPTSDADDALPPELAAQPEILALIPREAFDATGGTILPEALVLHADAPWAPHAAMAMSGRLLRAAAGHGDETLVVARAYGTFFEAVRARAPKQELVRRLSVADELLGALERRADAASRAGEAPRR